MTKIQTYVFSVFKVLATLPLEQALLGAQRQGTLVMPYLLQVPQVAGLEPRLEDLTVIQEMETPQQTVPLVLPQMETEVLQPPLQILPLATPPPPTIITMPTGQDHVHLKLRHHLVVTLPYYEFQLVDGLTDLVPF